MNLYEYIVGVIVCLSTEGLMCIKDSQMKHLSTLYKEVPLCM
jgi:hypothetical protein